MYSEKNEHREPSLCVSVFLEREEDGIEEACFGIIVCAVVFLNGPC
jgi:hypothetical protein